MALLKALAKRYDKCQYLEIGTWRGESVANVSSVAQQCVTIDLPDKELIKFGGFNSEHLKLRAFFSKELKNVTHIKHNSITFDYSSLGKKFDLIFVDGDHRYEGVKNDTKNVFKLLKDDNSVIVWHDYGVTSEKISWTVLAGILDGCPEDKRDRLYHVSNTRCAIYINKTLKAYFMKSPHLPNKYFEIKITGKRIDS